MAVPLNQNVHMETLEKAKDENPEPLQVGNPVRNGLSGRELSKRLLVDEQHSSSQNGNDKRKAGTLRLFRFSRSIPVSA